MTEVDLFISYSSSDTAFTEILVSEIESRGIKCWYAKRDIPLGGTYPIEISRALNACRALLLVFSKETNRAANENLHILREIEYAASQHKPILPVRIAYAEPHEGLAYFLRTVQWIEKAAWENRLADHIAEVFHGTPSAERRTASDTATGARAISKRSKTGIVVAGVLLIVAVSLGGAMVERDRILASLGYVQDRARQTDPASPSAVADSGPREPQHRPSSGVPSEPPRSTTAPPVAAPVPSPAPAAVLNVRIEPPAPPMSVSSPTLTAASAINLLEQARAAIARLNYQTAVDLLTPMAEAGNAVAAFNLASLAENGQGTSVDRARATELVRRAAMHGLACAMNRLGELHEDGTFGYRNLQEATHWWRSGAAAGCPWAKFHLGLAYKDGTGVVRSGTDAVRWLNQAADDGVIDAMSYLASIYRKGELVPADPGAVVRHLRQAAMLGHENAQYRLAMAYNSGQGVSRDPNEAYTWAVVSAVKGEPEPARLRNIIAKSLPPFTATELDEAARRRVDDIRRAERSNGLRLEDWSWR